MFSGTKFRNSFEKALKVMQEAKDVLSKLQTVTLFNLSGLFSAVLKKPDRPKHCHCLLFAKCIASFEQIFGNGFTTLFNNK